MAYTKRPEAPRFTTDKGVFSWPKLDEPDTKFKADGEYTVKLVQTEAQAKRIIDTLEPFYRQAVERADTLFKALSVKARKDFESKGVKGPVLNPLFSVVYDEETEQPTGDVEMNFKMAASGAYKEGHKKFGQRWSRHPDIYDARGVKMNPVPSIYGGTVGKVSFELGVDFKTGEPGYFIPGTAAAGLTLRLRGVQIISLVSGQGGSAADHGFGNEAGEDEAETASADSDSDF